MKSILRDPANAERLLKLTSETMLLIDAQGVCIDIQVNELDLWFIHEELLLGKNLFQLMPPSTAYCVRQGFERVLRQGETVIHNYELPLRDGTYYFKCIMRPYDDMVLCHYRDITERARRKLQLERINHELNEIQKAASMGHWRLNYTTRTLRYHGHTGMLSTPQEQEITLEDYRSVIIPEDLDSFDQCLQAYRKGDLDRSLTYRVHIHGSIYYIAIRAYAREVNHLGELIVEGYLQNITSIQRNRNDINLLTHAIDNSIEDIFAAKEDGTLLFANRRFREHHGISPDTDITTVQFASLTSSPQNNEVWENMVKNVVHGSHDNTFVVYNPLKDRPDILAYEGNAYWVTSDEGYEVLWAFGRDISQRILHEQQIKRLSFILNKVVESLPAGIVVKDPLHGYRYLYRNRESHNRLDVNRGKEAIGKTDFDFYEPNVAREKREQDQQIMASGKEMHWVAEETDLYGRTLYLDKRKMRLSSNDFPPILLSIEWDITETERMRRELQKAKEKAEASDRLKSAFLANMSHEIRTPLNAIVGFSRLIAESNDYNDRQSFYQIVDANNERLLRLINEILDLSKIEANMVEFTLAPLRLAHLFQEIYDAHLLRCPGGVELRNEADPQSPLILTTDKTRLFQVVSNLIGNAFKFTTQGSISFGFRQGQTPEGTHCVVIYVRDTGIGIAPDKLDRVFERFVKVNTFAQGTGLGLSISKTIIEKLGGQISVSSEQGVGTEFTFWLPFTEQDAEASAEQLPDTTETPAAASTPADTGTAQATSPQRIPATENTGADHPLLILAAEDTDSNYVLLKAMIGKRYRLERAKDGMEAVNRYEELHPDLILMDIKMPNLDGLDATRIIRELDAHVPIIALTAYAFDSDRQNAREAGCNDFMTKPYTPEQLFETIRKWTERHEEQEPKEEPTSTL